MEIVSPTSESQLLSRAEAIAGWTLGELALELNVEVPENLLHHKGWGGQLLERWLGASAGSKPEPDFQQLGIELKTIPINQHGKPLETTFVSVCPLTDLTGLRWADSPVFHKLQCILWIPILAERQIAVADRIIGMPILWRPNAQELALLQQDWEEIIERVALGEVESITARHGEVLQLRPKAANSRVLTEAIGPGGAKIQTLPRGFYLKIDFTHHILRPK
ncbi:DNA mismatch repair endonuclease MutH [Ferrimonas aestuarii]|uniref:DNA mismatch repair protein MutH n=1 Tax=Ferrimonas aestuarii TaxID=2569539 RepID=A0A4U1BPQ7_9GAMM|nr:DNA mismatch repair endonuclease MutH [Ferrimonas aestuarii]TKB55542.1 DNA mismatch repair endonuclease MutH [Ferrimonas aestuarii]